MGSVVITACLPCDKVKQFEEVVITLLRGYDADVSVFTHVDGSVSVMATEKPCDVQEPVTTAPTVDLLPAPPPVVEPPAEVTYELPSPTPGIPELEVDINLDPSHVLPTDPVPSPELPPLPPVTGEVVLKDLSNVCAVPFCVDHSVECSELVVQGLTVAADCVIFTYCGSTYKLPVASPMNSALVYNANPQYTSTSIRVIADVVGSHGDGFPIIIKLVDGPECKVVFGRDVGEILFHDVPNSNQVSQEALPSESLPA